jgi:hypothetical protein
MAEYSRIAKGSFTATSGSKTVVLPFVPDYVEVWNYTNFKTPVNHGVVRAFWDNKLLDGSNNPTMIELGNATPVLTTDVILTNGITPFQGALSLQFGPVYQHTAGTDFSINKAASAQITTTTNHLLNTGDVVIFSNLAQTSTTGMNQIAGIPFMVTRTGATTFTINWNTNQSNYTAFNTATSTNNVGSYKKVLYPDLYLPNDNFISALTLGATTTVSTTAQHQMQVGQEVAFRIPAAWGTIEINSLPNVVIPGSPIYGYVVSVTDVQNYVVNINSTAYTAFNSNVAFASSGRTFAQVVAVGDVNSGGELISTGSVLYPPPKFSVVTYNDSNTINGPAIKGAFVNNTRMGFVIGPGLANTDTAAQIMVSTNIVYWRAYLSDFVAP